MFVNKVGRGQAHAKLILIGEHAVVYGQPAISLPVKVLQMNVVLTENHYGQYIVDKNAFRSLNLMGDNFEGIRQLILKLLVKFDKKDMNFSLEIDSNIPRGRGFGASAALATAVTEAFFDYFDQELTREELLYFTNFSETIMHGRASGIDAATVISDQPLWFIKGQPVESLPMKVSGFLVLADSGIRGLTSQAIATVRQSMEEYPEETENKLAALGQLTMKMREDLILSNLTAIGQRMNEAQQLLATLGVSHPKLNRLIETANLKGALGAKLTGSGLGGTIIALAKNEQSAIKISQALAEKGAQATWIYSF